MLVKEYAKLVGVSTVAVTKRLKENNPPKAIVAYRKYGNTYDITCDTAELEKLIIKRKRKANVSVAG